METEQKNHETTPTFDFVKNRGPVSMCFGKAIDLRGLGVYDLLEKLRLASQEKLAANSDDWISLHEAYDDSLVACKYSYESGSGYYKMSWAIDTDSQVQLGEPSQVEPVTTFVPMAKRYEVMAPSVFDGLV